MSVQGSPKLYGDCICKWLNEKESQIISASLLSVLPSALAFFLNRFIPGHYQIRHTQDYCFILPEVDLIGSAMRNIMSPNYFLFVTELGGSLGEGGTTCR